ncbi:glycosyltransferase family protein [Gillisia marina]|uniref:glycosyltransferase family 1 protein n=1 Tax=Gillisia marina TaxID=1167637 RepID=UPI0004949DB5|nr:glycosyltransferase family 1 protein [Gillisia marina]
MRIIFVCGSLEVGRDGVGDYTRRLASELIRQGNQVAILAFNDRNVNGIIREKQKQEGINVNVLRLGSKAPARNRLRNAKTWIEEFNPEWISLQYVPFSFHEKGLPWRLGNQLLKLGAGKSWHIMFHELWVGMDKKASFKNRIYGALQKYIIKNTINVLDPKIVHTQTCLYREHISQLGYKVELLPLFGNIPIIDLQEEKKNEDLIKIAVFGGIHFGANLKKMVKKLPEKNKYKFYFIGSNGPEQRNWIDVLKEHNIDFRNYGWLENNEASKALSRCQWGLTSTPYYLTEKSGSAAAMLEHNLTVFCIARKWKPRNIRTKILTNDSIIRWSNSLNIAGFVENKDSKYEQNLEKVTRKFVKGLKSNQF